MRFIFFGYSGSAEDFSNKHTTSFFALCGDPVKTSLSCQWLPGSFSMGRVGLARCSIDLALNLDEVFSRYTREGN